MPLRGGSSKGAFESNVAELIRSGYPRRQAVAIAYRKAGEKRRKAKTMARTRVQTATLDLGVGEVHAPGAGSYGRALPPHRAIMEAVAATEMGEISAEKRNALPRNAFADPASRGYPIHDKAHADNAAARLEQQRGSMTPAKYRAIKRRIVAAQKRFGESPKPKKARDMRSTRGLRVSIDHPQHGRFEIRHMRSFERVACMRDGAEVAAFAVDAKAPERVLLDQRIELPTELAAAKGPIWINIAVPGHFEGHRSGPFTLDEKAFHQILRNYREVDGGEVAFDFEHASEMDAAEGAIGSNGAPAQAWIRDMKIEGGRLYALVDLLEPARTYIAEKKYRFVSPAIRFGAKHPRTGAAIGARLTSVAFTNQPFLRGLEPIAAKDQPMSETTIEAGAVEMGGAHEARFAYSAHEYMPRLRSALKMGELATPMEMSDQLSRLREHLKVAGGDVSAMVHGVRLNDYVAPLREIACGGAMGSTLGEVLDIVEEMIESAIEQHEAAYHGGEEEVEQRLDDTEEETGTMAAADKTGAEQATLLSEAQVRVGELQKSVSAKDAELAEKSSALKDAEGKVLARDELIKGKDAEIARLQGELKALRDEQDEKLLAEAHATYKDAKGVTLDSMRLILKADRAAFVKEFPPIDPDKRHMMRDLTGEGERKNPPKVREGGDGEDVPSIEVLTTTIMKDNPGMNFFDAQNKALLRQRQLLARG